jgi:CRISPR-associated protein Cmr1
VRLRLDSWAIGKLRSWENLEKDNVRHPEIEKTGYKVGPHAYLGYGPLDGRGGTRFSEKIKAAIQSGESAALAIAWPTRHNDLVLQSVLDENNARHRFERALALMHGFGTLGGRSRNGWGSFALTPQGDTDPLALDLPLRPWRDCLDRDWPHAIGGDDKGPLIWQTAPQPDWKALMKTLAVVKIGLRTQFVFTTGKNAPNPEDRHWLSYPVTNHSVQSWGGSARLPNSLRFKVRALPDGRLAGVIFHVPCLPPPAFRPDRRAIEGVWQRIYAPLDELSQEKGKRAYASIEDLQRRTALKPLLDSLTLQRVQE